MIELPQGWQLVGGLPVLVDGDFCVIAYTYEGGGNNGGRISLYAARMWIQHGGVYDPFTLTHFAAAEKLLRDYKEKQAEADIEEVFRSEYVTVFRRKRDGKEMTVTDDGSGWCRWGLLGCKNYCPYSTRPEAESAARAALCRKGE